MSKEKNLCVYPLTCPHCQVTGQSAIHLNNSTINDLHATLACHCYACKKPFKVTFIRQVRGLNGEGHLFHQIQTFPMPKCYNLIVTDCEGCAYYAGQKCLCGQDTDTTAGANTFDWGAQHT